MPVLPIVKKLKRKIHRTVALAQDILVMEIYDNFPTAVIHGGTAIWRCYGSNRFSEDVDVYLVPTSRRSDMQGFLVGLKGKGLTVDRFKDTDGMIFAKLHFMGVAVRCEILFKHVKDYVVKQFEMSDGNSILVNTLRPEQMIRAKISAYTGRRKVRDLYDIFFLLKIVERKKELRGLLVKLVNEFQEPEDERELKALIISGSVPTVDDMLELVRAWVK